jgi:hypothetical protein
MQEKIRGNHFSASGSPETMKTHEKLVSYYNRMETIRTACAYAASVCFAGIAMLLLIFQPPTLGPLALLAAAGLLVLAACLAGFTSLKMLFPAFQVRASFREENKNEP